MFAAKRCMFCEQFYCKTRMLVTKVKNLRLDCTIFGIPYHKISGDDFPNKRKKKHKFLLDDKQLS